MQDIQLVERCPKCNSLLWLRESINVTNNKSYLVKYCLLGCVPVEEVIEIRDPYGNDHP